MLPNLAPDATPTTTVPTPIVSQGRNDTLTARVSSSTNGVPLLLGHHVNCSQAGFPIAGSKCPLCGGLDPRDVALYDRLSDGYSTVNAPLGYVSGGVAGLQWASPRLQSGGWPGDSGRVNGAVAPVGSVGASPAGALASAHFFFR